MAELIDLVPKEFKDNLTDAEKRIIEKAPTGEMADMRSGDDKTDDPANAEKWSESRRVRAKFLEWLLRDKKARDFIHDKGIIISGIRIEGGLNLYSLTFPFPLNIQYSHFANDVNLNFARVKLIDFSNSRFENFLADGLDIELMACFKNSISEGKFRLVAANIGGDLVCTGAKFINKEGESFNGGTMITKGTVFLRGIESTGTFGIIGANIDGSLVCTGAKFINGEGKAFTGDAFNVGDNIFLYDIEVTGQFRLVSSTVGGGIFFRGAMFSFPDGTALFLTDTNIKRRLCLDSIKKIDGTIDLENTKAGAFRDDAESWPDQGKLIINGFEYGSFADDTPTDVKTRLEWLRLQPQGEYIPQPYQQLAKVYRKMGRDKDAKKVLLAKERMRREFGDIGELAKLWCWFLDKTIGYGYQIGKALGIVAVIIALGVLIFGFSNCYNIIQLTSKGTTDKALFEFSPLFYSIDLFVPFLDLRQENYWIVNSNVKWGWWVQLYSYIHIILGWIFSSLLVAGFTGLIRKE